MRNENRRRRARHMVGAVGAAALMLCGIVLPASVATAAESAPPASGAASADGGAGARANYVGGGIWEYGVSGGKVWSKYQHPSRDHKATACARALCAHSGWKSPNFLAVASRTKSRTGNTAYWGVG